MAQGCWRRRADAVHDGWDWSVVAALATSGSDGSSITTNTATFSPADPCLIVGDLWTNSVLVDAARRTVWIVDWEAAEVGRPGRDVALLVDHLWIMTQNPSKYDVSRTRKLIRAFEPVFFVINHPTRPATAAGATASAVCAATTASVSGAAGAGSTDGGGADWRFGREPEFLRSVAMFAGSPHYGLDHLGALRSALDEIAALP